MILLARLAPRIPSLRSILLPLFYLFLSVAWGTALAGCGGGQPRDPSEVLRRYVEAVRSDDPARAYALLDPATQKQISAAEFSARWAQFKPELDAQAASLAQRVREPVPVTATLAYPSGIQVRALWTASGWVIDNGLGLFSRTSTPKAALQALIQAAEKLDFKSIYAMLSPKARERLKMDLKTRLQGLRRALEDNKVEVTQDKARIEYGPAQIIELIEKDGQWLINDVVN